MRVNGSTGDMCGFVSIGHERTKTCVSVSTTGKSAIGPASHLHQKIAVASISTFSSGATSAEISTSVAAGR